MLLLQHVNNDGNAHMLESYYSIFLIWNACDSLWPYSCTCNSHCRICITGGEIIFNYNCIAFYVDACVRVCHILPPVVRLVVVLVVLLSFCLGLYWLLSVHT